MAIKSIRPYRVFRPIFFFIIAFVLSSGPGPSEATVKNAGAADYGQSLQRITLSLPDRPEKSAERRGLLQSKIDVMKSLGGGPLINGNNVTLLINGPVTYAARFEAIEAAKDHVNLEVFSIEDNERGRMFADLLIKKQLEGVQVNLMYDSAGSFHSPASFFERMRKNGIRVLEFNPLNPFKARGTWRPWLRDHRKVVIVDGKIVITGGINFTQDYSTGLFPGEEERRKARLLWRDTDVRIEGPAVAEFQKTFLDTWKRQQGPDLPKRDYFPASKKEGDYMVGAVASSQGRLRDDVYRMYLAIINSAEKSAYLTNTFLVPDGKMQKALIDAAVRGVDVRLILPAFSDDPMTFQAARYYYSRFLKSGIRIFERRKEILHAKTAVIDGVWSTVGSTNIDYWSFFYNNEENAVILGDTFADKMQEMFAYDLGKSSEIKLEEWEKRPLFDKVKEWLAHLFAYWL